MEKINVYKTISAAGPERTTKPQTVTEENIRIEIYNLKAQYTVTFSTIDSTGIKIQSYEIK